MVAAAGPAGDPVAWRRSYEYIRSRRGGEAPFGAAYRHGGVAGSAGGVPRKTLPYQKLLLTLVASLLWAPLAATQTPAAPLQAEAEAIVAGVRGEWSVMAWSIDRREVLFAIEPHRALVPASNNKLFTAVWALDRLGAEHRFSTDLLLAGEVDAAGVLHGDVVIRGSGDPGFGAPEYQADPMRPLRTMARRVRESGVRAVNGRVIADASVFDTVGVGPAWPQDTGGGSAAYAPRVSGLAFHRNVLGVQLEPTQPGQPARVVRHPPVEEVPVVSNARTGGGRAWAVRRANTDTIVVHGAVAGRGLHRYDVGVADPALLAAGALRRALLDEGVQVGPAVRGTTPAGARPLHRHVSVPVATMIGKLNQDSDNFFAEQLFLATVADAAGRGSFDRGGPASAVFFHRRTGVPYGELYQADGSGLSAHNRASAYALVCALAYAHQAPYSEAFHRSLAVAGASGTLRRMFVNTGAEGNLHAKTGFIRGSRTLSGYVRTADGQLVAFSFLYNGPGTNPARAAQQELGALLASFPRSEPLPAGQASAAPVGEAARR
jgi:serine-type D-Ala-D-Ala carboxypeptidase/endopeptidase (penicillin-binding protein 4)